MCKLAGVKIYQLLSVKGSGGENGQLFTCNMLTLKQCRSDLCKIVHLLTTDMEKLYPEQLVKMLSMGVPAAVTKTEGGKRGRLSQTKHSAFPSLWGMKMRILPKEIWVVLEEKDNNN